RRQRLRPRRSFLRPAHEVARDGRVDLRARAEALGVELDRDLLLGVQAEHASGVEAQDEGRPRLVAARLHPHLSPGVEHARRNPGAVGSARGERGRGLLEIHVLRIRGGSGEENERKKHAVFDQPSLLSLDNPRSRIIHWLVRPPRWRPTHPSGDMAKVKDARSAAPADPASFRQSLLQLLETDPPHEEKLLRDFESRRDAGYPLYSSILYILTHLSFSEPEAARHWQKILPHPDRLRGEVRREPGLRVAILDYFANLNRELKNPKVIEISIYEKTERSAMTDGLTGLYNRGYFTQALRQEIQRCKRHDLRMAL